VVGRYLPSYLPIYLPTYLDIDLPTNLPTCLHAHLLSRECRRLVGRWIPTYLPTYLQTYLPTHLPTYLPTHLLSRKCRRHRPHAPLHSAALAPVLRATCMSIYLSSGNKGHTSHHTAVRPYKCTHIHAYITMYICTFIFWGHLLGRECRWRRPHPPLAFALAPILRTQGLFRPRVQRSLGQRLVVQALKFGMDSGFGFWGFGFWVWGLRFVVWSLGLGFEVWGVGFEVWGVG